MAVLVVFLDDDPDADVLAELLKAGDVQNIGTRAWLILAPGEDPRRQRTRERQRAWRRRQRDARDAEPRDARDALADLKILQFSGEDQSVPTSEAVREGLTDTPERDARDARRRDATDATRRDADDSWRMDPATAAEREQAQAKIREMSAQLRGQRER